MHFALVNLSTLVTDSDARLIAFAVNAQLHQHVGPKWARVAPTMAFYAKGHKPPAGSIFFQLVDSDEEVPDALGYHDEQKDAPYAVIMCKPVLESGGAVLDGELSVSGVVSHEAIETFGDVDVNSWRDMPDGRETADEWCDAVQDGSYNMTADGRHVAVSNFLLPAWFDRQATQGPFDFLGILSKPFTLTHGGYLIVRKPGEASQVLGDLPMHKKTGKSHRHVKRTKAPDGGTGIRPVLKSRAAKAVEGSTPSPGTSAESTPAA